MDPLLVDQKTIAKVLQIDPRRVRQLEKEGILTKHETEGLYYIPDCAQSYYQFKLKPTSAANYENEKALHEKAKREKAEMSNAKLRGQLHDAKDVELIMTNMLVNFRNKMLGLPSKLAGKLVRQKNINIISHELEKAIKEALMELSEYDPVLFVNKIEGVEDEAEDN